ncbi:MAG: hypothetical protein C4313_00725 [Thermoflexus sp.]
MWIVALSIALGRPHASSLAPMVRVGDAEAAAAGTSRLYLPLLLQEWGPAASRQVNAPRLSDPLGTDFARMAIFWFGRVTPTANYADVRVAYTDTELVVYVAVFDRRLWMDPDPSPTSLTAWDAVSLFLNLDGPVGSAPTAAAFHFIGGLSNADRSGRYQAAFRGDGVRWTRVSLPFGALAGWRGDALNNNGDDRGWAMTFEIPFAALGRNGPPPEGTLWGLALMVHDRDDATGTPIPATTWPERASPDRPASWGRLRFGLPVYAPPAARPGGTLTVRHRLNGATVRDAAVGGYTRCGSGLQDLWAQWGETTEAFYNPERSDFNIQNQVDVADWPCFSKYYVTFPLDGLPPGKAILSATLTLHLMGNGGSAETAPRSWIQVLTVNEDWDDRTLTWNNAPLAAENVGGAWVDPVRQWPGWPGIPYTWDVTYAVARAYASGQPLRLVLYSADGAYHSGKSFVSSDVEDWNAEGRPTLRILWGDP